jgi:hypothetical protein
MILMRLFRPTLLTSVFVFCGASTAFAGDMTAECPGILKEDVLKPGRVVAGWVTVTNQQHLIGAGMMSGAPETEAYLMPDKETKGKQTFEFTSGDGQRWLWCLYGGVRLAHRLDDKATSCTITTKTRKPELFVSAVVQCQ